MSLLDWHPFRSAEIDKDSDWSLKRLADWYGDHVYDMRVEFDEISVDLWVECESDDIDDMDAAYISVVVNGHDSTAGGMDLSDMLHKSFSADFSWSGPYAQRVALSKVRDTLDELIAQCDEAIIRDAATPHKNPHTEKPPEGGCEQ